MSDAREILGVKTNHPYIDEYRETVDKFFRDKKVKDNVESFFNEFRKELEDRRFSTSTSESEVETFVETIFRKLLYVVKQQSSGKVDGKTSRADVLLFASQDDKEAFEKSFTDSRIIDHEKILLVIEVKRPTFDIKKAEEQLYFYLNQYQKSFGISTNGSTWRFYDKSQVYTGERKYIEFDFSKILEGHFKKQEGFLLFYYLIRKDRYVGNEIREERIEREKAQETIKKTLKEILYASPDESIVFKVAKNIYEKGFDANPDISSKDLKIILEEAIIFVLRIFFIVYIEDKFKDVLDAHSVYKEKVSFRHYLYPKIDQENIGYDKLIAIFKLLDEGIENEFVKFPIFNGGLFSKTKAKYLAYKNLLEPREIKDILTKILFFNENNAKERKYVGYSRIDVKSFGELYEALLEYDLRIVKEIIYRVKKDGIYLIYTENNLPPEYKNLRKDITTYYSGDVYLTSMSLDRKKSGAFYTPDNLTEFMVASAIEEQLKSKSPFDIKIIDNSCGSGHFLITSLNYLTDKIYANIDDFEDVKIEMENERNLIEAETSKYGIKNVDDKLILKRMLLKKCIYGVDINPISVEVTMLSLWINTFIFGTPLSFIEHHIKTGDALIGYTRKEFFSTAYEALPDDAGFWLMRNEGEIIKKLMNRIEKCLNTLTCINDITREQIEKSKKIYAEYEKEASRLKLIFSLVKLYGLYSVKSLELQKRINFSSGSYEVTKLIDNIINGKISEDDNRIIKEVEALSSEYKIFHYGVEFPDVGDGFEVVIGNPPWEKVKFDESEFFAKYNPNYRQLSRSEQNKFKKEFKEEPLSNLCEDERVYVKKLNDIYKGGFKDFSNGGDPNFFRYFIGYNLRLITKGGNLTYLAPSSLWREHSSQKLRMFLFKNYKLNYLYQFENKKRFVDVYSNFKFAVFQLSNNGVGTSTFKARFMIQKDDKIVEEMAAGLRTGEKTESLPYRGFELSLGDIRSISPAQETILELKSNKELKLFTKMFKKFQILSEDYVNFGKGLDVTKHKAYFKEFDIRKDSDLFLYQGSNIYQFDSRYFEREESKNKLKFVWIGKEDLEKILSKRFNYKEFKIGYRKIARNTDERTMISTFQPKDSYCTDSLYLNYEKHLISVYKKLFIVAVFNSLPFDFLIRKFVEITVQKTCLYQCSMPQPSEEEILVNSIYLKLAKNACILIVKNDRENFAELLELEEFEFTKEDRGKILSLSPKDKYFKTIEREINFMVASLYSVTPDEFSLLLDDFKVLKRKKGENYILELVEEYKRWYSKKSKFESLLS
ncbi:Eco57I restriction-modification methylase domain-containing protein [Candidatus Borreliella tachyglossi]|uniref:Eco57I restriction-modification methylase domain-containing protein n=1 Tax=Candidatus Borreliella tachyglossi TaxID=1964448 RepID=UPI004041582D